MMYVYGPADGKARNISNARFPNDRAPMHKTFRNLFQWLIESGFFEKAPVSGGLLTTRTTQLEEAVLQAIEEDPQTSTN